MSRTTGSSRSICGRGHRWSDGSPFTAEDFRYWWEDVILNPDMPPFSPPPEMLSGGEPPKFEVLDETTVRYTWTSRTRVFLPALAAARPLDIFGPSAYLKKFHVKYADPAELKARVQGGGTEELGASP